MGRTALEKLRSRKGASLTFALLAFLVCAVISAVLLASASAATGRLSNLAETDQRYYAVTSAAQLFCDTLENQEFTIQRTHTNHAVKVKGYVTGEDGQTYGFEENDEIPIKKWFGSDVYDKKTNPDIYTFYVPELTNYAPTLTNPISYKGLAENDTTTAGEINSIRSTSLLADAALTYVIGQESCPVMEAYENRIPGSPFTKKDGAALVPVDKIAFGTYHLEYKKNGTDQAEEAPAVTVLATLRKDGSIVLEFCDGSDPTKPSYKVTVTLTAEVQDDSALPNTTTSDSYAFRLDPETGVSYECTVTTTVKTKTTTIKWNVTDIKKGAA